jgi:hypothetical protein
MRKFAVAMLVPKTAMDKNDLMPTRKNKIGAAWKVMTVEPITPSKTIDHTADEQFWLHAGAFYSTHIF